MILEIVFGGIFLATGVSVCPRAEEEEQSERERQEATATIVSECRARLQQECDAVAEKQRSPEASPRQRRSASDADLESLATSLQGSPVDVSAYEDTQVDMKRLRKKYGLGESPRFPLGYAAPHSPAHTQSQTALHLAVPAC